MCLPSSTCAAANKTKTGPSAASAPLPRTTAAVPNQKAPLNNARPQNAQAHAPAPGKRKLADEEQGKESA